MKTDEYTAFMEVALQYVRGREKKQITYQVVMDDKKKIKQSVGSWEYLKQDRVGKSFYFIYMVQGRSGSDSYSDEGTFEQKDLKTVTHVNMCMRVASEEGRCLA